MNRHLVKIRDAMDNKNYDLAMQLLEVGLTQASGFTNLEDFQYELLDELSRVYERTNRPKLAEETRDKARKAQAEFFHRVLESTRKQNSS